MVMTDHDDAQPDPPEPDPPDDSGAERPRGPTIDTLTVEVELDEARSLMYKRARETSEYDVEQHLESVVEDAVEQLYDNQEKLEQAKQRREQQSIQQLRQQLE